MGMHIIYTGAEDQDDGDDALFEMRLRDTHRQNARRHGACEDDCERTARRVDGDFREQHDPFFSRPLSLTHQEREKQESDFDAFLKAGFHADVDRAVFDNERKQGRSPFRNFRF